MAAKRKHEKVDLSELGIGDERVCIARKDLEHVIQCELDGHGSSTGGVDVYFPFLFGPECDGSGGPAVSSPLSIDVSIPLAKTVGHPIIYRADIGKEMRMQIDCWREGDDSFSDTGILMAKAFIRLGEQMLKAISALPKNEVGK